MTPDDESPAEHAGIPRTWSDLRARIRDARTFGEHVNPPLAFGSDLVHRTVLLAIVAAVTALFVALMTTPGIAIFGHTVGTLADKFDVKVGSAELPKIAQRSVVVDRNGKILATLAGEENRIVVPLSKIPKRARNAVIAVEDAKFYEHHGVDLAGLARATLLNFRSGAIRQGGSTITQQLVKNVLVGSEQSLERKIREAKLAVELEKHMSKAEILELYLNETYFGNGVYGIATASEFYFGHKVGKLTLAESALLAGIIKAPTTYDPLKYPEEALARRATALKRMLDEGMITPEREAALVDAPLRAKAHKLPGAQTPYFVEYVKAQILDDERFGPTREERARALFQAGLRIETTMDLDLQEQARRANVQILDQKDDPASALVSIDPKTGGVIAMVGGRDFDESKFNLAVQSRRQPGSTFKPMTMVAALEEGLAPSFTLDTPSPLKLNDPNTGKKYKVANYDGRSRGFIDMRTATELSVNTYYVQLIEKVGPQKVVEVAHALGITSDLQPYLSLALGTIGVSPLELASAYATLANDGVHCTPYGITKVTDAEGHTLLRNTPDCNRTIPKEIAAQATDILRYVPIRGTGRTNGQIGRPSAAKTGTTDDYTDAWYAGYTPQFATVVWLGYPDDTSRSLYNIHGLPKVYGGSLPAMIWARFMRAAHEGLPIEPWPKTPKVERGTVPDVVGQAFKDARATLEDAGYTVRKVVVAAEEADGTVVGQDPAGGTKTKPGIVVELQVSDGSVEPPQCRNGIDDDGDGKIDTADKGCSSPDDNDESDDPKPSPKPTPKPSPSGSTSPSPSPSP